MKQWLRLDEAAERENARPALDRQRLLSSAVALQSRVGGEVAAVKAEIERTTSDNPVLDLGHSGAGDTDPSLVQVQYRPP